MSKTLGQIFVEAEVEYLRKEYPEAGLAFTPWDRLPKDIQRLKQAAAEAVVKHLGEVPCGIDCGRSRAVIEAAKAWEKEGGGQSQVPSAAEARLWETLQALDSEEG